VVLTQIQSITKVSFETMNEIDGMHKSGATHQGGHQLPNPDPASVVSDALTLTANDVHESDWEMNEQHQQKKKVG